MSDTAINKFLQYGTNAQRLAFTPAPAVGTQPIYEWYESDTDTTWIYTTGWHQVSGSGGGVTASGTLTANRVILGAGTSVVTPLGSLGTTTTVLHGNAAGAPSFAQVTSSDVNNTIWTGTVASGVLKASVQGTVAAATDGTDYLSPTTGLTKINETILGSDTATITFSSIPSSYRNLVLTLTVRNDNVASGATDGYIQFNGDTSANYSRSFVFWKGAGAAGTGYGTGETISNAKAPAFFAINDGAAANLATTARITIYDYARTSWKKNAYIEMVIPLAISTTNLNGNSVSYHWASTAAINAILIGMTDSSKMKANTVASLYGMP